MVSAEATHHVYCSCGQTELGGEGEPLAVIVCYCDDCQAASQQIGALPGGHGGASADGGTISVLFRKDRVRLLRGGERLVDHKLRPESKTIRRIASCCNSNMLSRFENWLPFVALRTHSVNVGSLQPEVCLHTRFAPDIARIAYAAPKHAGLPPSLVMKLLGASVQLGLQRFSAAARPSL